MFDPESFPNDADIDQDEIENPIHAFAAALNPAHGALADALPFALAREIAPTPAPTQAALFSSPEDESC
jgi:hypothetical protein